MTDQENKPQKFVSNPLRKFTDIGSIYFKPESYSDDKKFIDKLISFYDQKILLNKQLDDILTFIQEELKKVSKESENSAPISKLLLLENRKEKLLRIISAFNEAKAQTNTFKESSGIARVRVEVEEKKEKDAKEEAKKEEVEEGAEDKKNDPASEYLQKVIDLFEKDEAGEGLNADETLLNIDYLIVTVLYETEFLVYKTLIPNITTISTKSADKYFGVFPNSITSLGYKLNEKTNTISKFLIVCSNRMGMLHNSLLIANILGSKYGRNILFIGSSGICAGIKDKVGIGDAIIPSLVFDYSTGKSKGQGIPNAESFEPYWYPIEIKPEHEAHMTIYAAENKTKICNYQAIKSIDSNFNIGESPKEKYRIHFSPFATGSTVVSSKSQVEMISKLRGKLIGFDMEAFGLFYATYKLNADVERACFVVKGVSDFADENKGNDFKDAHQLLAAYNSAEVLLEIIERYPFEKTAS